MIEQKQLYLHKPEQGIIGDCFRTTIACLLDLPALEVPHWYAEIWPPGELTCEISQEVLIACNKWLLPKGLQYAEFPVGAANNEELFNWLACYFPSNVYLGLGCSSKNGGHSVVINSSGYIWDPAIDNSGCVGPMKDDYYWVGMLVKSEVP